MRCSKNPKSVRTDVSNQPVVDKNGCPRLKTELFDFHPVCTQIILEVNFTVSDVTDFVLNVCDTIVCRLHYKSTGPAFSDCKHVNMYY